MTTLDSTSAPECLRCGACCFSRGERYVPVTGSCHQRLGDDAESLTQFFGNRCFMRMQDDHCAALHITAEGRYVCSVYERRPEVCRTLERGGASCLAELSAKRPDAERALLQLASP
jgi:Fe-S-cluster containining protein